MSVIDNIKKDFKVFYSKYSEQDPVLRSLDLLSLLSIVAFGVVFLVIRIFDIETTPANAISLVAPLVIGGLIFAFRTKIDEDGADVSKLTKEFMYYAVALIVIIIALPVAFFII